MVLLSTEIFGGRQYSRYCIDRHSMVLVRQVQLKLLREKITSVEHQWSTFNLSQRKQLSLLSWCFLGLRCVDAWRLSWLNTVIQLRDRQDQLDLCTKPIVCQSEMLPYSYKMWTHYGLNAQIRVRQLPFAFVLSTGVLALRACQSIMGSTTNRTAQNSRSSFAWHQAWRSSSSGTTGSERSITRTGGWVRSFIAGEVPVPQRSTTSFRSLMWIQEWSAGSTLSWSPIPCPMGGGASPCKLWKLLVYSFWSPALLPPESGSWMGRVNVLVYCGIAGSGQLPGWRLAENLRCHWGFGWIDDEILVLISLSILNTKKLCWNDSFIWRAKHFFASCRWQQWPKPLNYQLPVRDATCKVLILTQRAWAISVLLTPTFRKLISAEPISAICICSRQTFRERIYVVPISVIHSFPDHQTFETLTFVEQIWMMCGSPMQICEERTYVAPTWVWLQPLRVLIYAGRRLMKAFIAKSWLISPTESVCRTPPCRMAKLFEIVVNFDEI